jgi:ribose 5-phosphate isomerase A
MLWRMSPQKAREELEREKQVAARAALWWVRSGMTLGLGTGSTAQYFILLLGERVRAGELTIGAVASSTESENTARQAGITLVEAKRGLRLDLTVDGADEIAPDLDLIKGAGGALLREKVLAQGAQYFLVIGDSSKRVAHLGNVPLPVEVVPFGLPWVMDRIQELGADPVLRTSAGGDIFLTDQRNYILDCHFEKIESPRVLAARLKEIPGVVEHGIFLHEAISDRAQAAVVAEGTGALVLRPGVPPVRFEEFTELQEGAGG